MREKCVLMVAIIWVAGGSAEEKTDSDITGRISRACTADDGQLCLFPFIFRGKTYNECTYAGNTSTPWCALEKNSNHEVIKNEWGNCDLVIGNCTVERTGNVNKDCYTTGGPDIGKSCIFPFVHGGKEYHDCTSDGHKEGKLWCSTKVDRIGQHIAGQDFFGTCTEMCFWNNWSKWGKCSAFCGGVFKGSQERIRNCKETNCMGNKKETRSCYNMNKCVKGAPCKIGSTWKQDCNICICTSKGKTMCTSNLCPVTPVPLPDPCTSDPDDRNPQCTDSNICMTDSGPTSNQRCVFPFQLVGRTFNNCDVWRWGGKDEGKFWCSTKTDAKGIHINGQGHYGFCPETEACRGLDLTINARQIDSNAPE